jgi:hypothetical protein
MASSRLFAAALFGSLVLFPSGMILFAGLEPV